MCRLLVELLCEAANGNQEPCIMVGLANIKDITYITRAFSKSEKSLSSSSSLLAALIAAIWRCASSSLWDIHFVSSPRVLDGSPSSWN
jgi:hypothetical protein